jgi:integrase
MTTLASRLKFTKRALDALPNAAIGVKYYYDLECRGLALSVGSTGRKSFLIYRKVNGVPRRISLGRYPDLPIEEARRRVAAAYGELAKGKNPFVQPMSVPTLRAAFDKYYREYSSIHKITHLEDVAKFNIHVDTKRYELRIAEKMLSQITSADIRGLHLAIGKAGHPTTANRVISLVSSIFNKCRAWGEYDGPNPCQSLSRYSERSRERFIRPSEMPRFLKAVRAEPSEIARDFLLVALFTGARKGNVQAMAWQEVDLNRRVWTIGRTKNGDSQVVHLSSPAVDILTQRKALMQASGQPQGFVFPGNGKTGHIVEPKKAWARALMRATASGLADQMEAHALKGEIPEVEARIARCEADLSPSTLIERLESRTDLDFQSAEMRDLHFHDLRRTTGAWLASKGTNLAIIAKVLNHKTLAATQVYARVWSEAARDALEMTATAFQGAAIAE